MASLYYLWANRAKFNVTNPLFYRAWAKRFLSFLELSKRNNRRIKLINQGVQIDELSEIGDVIIQGKKNFLKNGKFFLEKHQ